MQLSGDTYSIAFDEPARTISFEGSLRLESVKEYQKIHKFMMDVIELEIPSVNLDFTKVDFLNSSGIAMLCRYILDAKKKDKVPVRVTGNPKVLWQKKSFLNLKYLWEKVEVVFNE